MPDSHFLKLEREGLQRKKLPFVLISLMIFSDLGQPLFTINSDLHNLSNQSIAVSLF
jgi:hypothetical protein